MFSRTFHQKRVPSNSPDTQAATPGLQTLPHGENHAGSRTGSHKPEKPKSFVHEAIVGVLCLLAWIVIVDIGLLVSSQPYRDNLAQMSKHGLWFNLGSLTMTFISYTWSNVALLCLIASTLGTMGHRSGIGGSSDRLIGAHRGDCAKQYTSALLRGFFVFLLLLSGGLLFGNVDFSNPTPGGYAHLAGVASLVSFLIGRDPELFANLAQKASELKIQTQDDKDEHKGAAPQETGKTSVPVTLDKDHVTTQHDHTHVETEIAPAMLDKAITRVLDDKAAQGK